MFGVTTNYHTDSDKVPLAFDSVTEVCHQCSLWQATQTIPAEGFF